MNSGFGITDPNDYIGIYSEEDDLQIVTDAAVRAATAHKSPPTVRATPVAELGGKVRVVTACPAVDVVVGDAARKTVWPLLERESRIDLSGQRTLDESAQRFVDEVARSVVGARAAEFYSADLSAATDLMPHVLISALWRGVMCGLGVSSSERLYQVGDRLLGPVRVYYPGLAENEVSPCITTPASRSEGRLAWP